MPTNASGKAEQAGDSASLEIVARAGLIAYGGVHLLVGWLAVQIAWGASDSKSAPRDLQRQPADEQVNAAVSDKPGAGEPFQRRAVAGLFGLAAGSGWHRWDPPLRRRV